MAAGLHANVKILDRISSDCVKSTFISTTGADDCVLDLALEDACLDADISSCRVVVEPRRPNS